MTEPIQEALTLADLQRQIATHCELGEPKASLAHGNPHLATQQTAQREVTDFVTAQFVHECHRRPEGMTPRDQARFERKMNQRVGKFLKRRQVPQLDANGDKCGFVIIATILGGVISWLVGQALSALWAWWCRRRDAKPGELAAMAAEALTCGAAEFADDTE